MAPDGVYSPEASLWDLVRFSKRGSFVAISFSVPGFGASLMKGCAGLHCRSLEITFV